MENYIAVVDHIQDNYHVIHQPACQSFGKFLYDLVQEFYDTAVLKNIKPKENEWTIFSSVIMQHQNEFKVIAFSSGTKSMPNKNYSSKSFQIFDCHAEILSLRCLKMFLIKCLIYNLFKQAKINEQEDYYWKKYSLFKEEFDLFESNSNFFEIFEFGKTAAQLKSNVYFHLYISQIPCGDAMLRLDDGNETVSSSLTGAKTVEEAYNFYMNNLGKDKARFHAESIDKTKGKFRTKPIRSDFEQKGLSLCLSCTDKLMLKNLLGIQGKHLSRFISPVYLSSLVISLDNQTTDDDLQILTNSILLGISPLRRLNAVGICNTGKGRDKLHYNEPTVILLRENNLIPSRVSKSEKNSLSYAFYWYFSNVTFMKIDPVSGLKLGTNQGAKYIERGRSDICQYEIIQWIYFLLKLYSDCNNMTWNSKKVNSLITQINASGKSNLSEIFDIISSKWRHARIKNKIFTCENVNEFLNLKHKLLNIIK